MAKTIRFDVSEEQHERLKDIKDDRGYNWKGLMLEGAKALDTETTGE